MAKPPTILGKDWRDTKPVELTGWLPQRHLDLLEQLTDRVSMQSGKNVSKAAVLRRAFDVWCITVAFDGLDPKALAQATDTVGSVKLALNPERADVLMDACERKGIEPGQVIQMALDTYAVYLGGEQAGKE